MRDPYGKWGKFAVTEPSLQEGVFRWRKQLAHGTIDLRTQEELPRERRKSVPKRLVASSLKKARRPQEKNITREQVLREMAAIYKRDSAFSASLASFTAVKNKNSPTSSPLRQSFAGHTKVSRGTLRLRSAGLTTRPTGDRAGLSHTVAFGELRGGQRRSVSNEAGRSQDISPSHYVVSQKKQRGIPTALLVLTLFITAGIAATFFFTQHILRKNADLSADIPRIYEMIRSGAESMTLGSFTSAKENFAKADEGLASMTDALTTLDGKAAAFSFMQNSLFGSAYGHLLTASQNLASAGTKTSKAMELLLGASVFPDVSKITLADDFFAEARALAFQAQESMQRIGGKDIAQSKDNQFSKAYSVLFQLNHSLQSIFASADTALGLLGARGEKTYLVVIQNPNIIRPTGGFIRAVAKLKLQNGKVSDFSLEDAYAIDARLGVNRVPPYPLKLLATSWSLHDSNWFSQFPAVAQKIVWFYEKSGGETPDGVIAVTTSALGKIIDNLGGVTLPDGSILSGDLLNKVAGEDRALLGSTGKPSTLFELLTKLLPKLVSSLTSSDTGAQRNKIIKGLREDVMAKNILFYAFDDNENEFLRSSGLTGEIKSDNFASAISDTMEVVFTNLSGLPLDKHITTRIENRTIVLPGGELERIVHVSRTLPKKSRREVSQSAVDYVRFYAPIGSTFISAEGFSPTPDLPEFYYETSRFLPDPDVEATRLGVNNDLATRTDIFEEGGMQTFGNWLTIKSGETKTAQIVYRLPKKLTGVQSYALMMSSQPGLESSLLLRIETNGNAEIVSCADKPYSRGILERVLEFSSDQYIYCTLKKM